MSKLRKKKWDFNISNNVLSAEKIKKYSLPVYIYGAGVMAERVTSKINQYHIQVNAYVVDNEFSGKINSMALQPTMCISDITDSEYVVVIGIEKLICQHDLVKKKFDGCVEVFSFCELFGDIIEPITIDDYNQHFQDYDKVYDLLEDSFSKKSYLAYLHAKIEENAKYVQPFLTYPQCFFDCSYWEFSNDEIFVDGGAYDGDTVDEFISKVNNNYSKIYAWEPDKENLKLLYNNIKKYHDVEVVEKGMYYKESILAFSREESGDQSHLCQEGDIEIPVDSLDHVLNGRPVTLIKMDIEGAELDALKGGKETIRNFQPMLFISIYHRASDPYNIINLIKSISDKYHFYLRIHHVMGLDTILYAIPDHRMISC